MAHRHSSAGKGVLLFCGLALLALGMARRVETSGGYGQGLKPEWKGPCAASEQVDVNLGHSPERFVMAAWCQITGQKAQASLVESWAKKLRKDPNLRRVDVVYHLCKQAGKDCKLSYSDPWVSHPRLPPAPCEGRPGLEIGAVAMFFFHCPGGVNCGMDWANTHAPGMEAPSPLLAWQGKPGHYQAGNAGFWLHELRDARAAGLTFLLPNVYGPDIQEGRVKTLAQALEAEANPVKIGLFDDTWSWGEKWFGPFWQEKPSFLSPEKAARKLYESKWKPFFSQIPKKHWYKVKDRPFIYFYNSGKLVPRNRSAATLRRMKELFKADFGMEPYLVADVAYFEDPSMVKVADHRFVWAPLEKDDGLARESMGGVTLGHAMVRWDSVGREHPGRAAGAGDRIFKGPDRLRKALEHCKDCDILVLATWNDLGEGTGINRNYDYYFLGRWIAPDGFMRIVQRHRCAGS